jgi:hypothetical protein
VEFAGEEAEVARVISGVPTGTESIAMKKNVKKIAARKP